MHWAEANPDAKRLYDDLLSHYNRLIRPVSNNSEVVTVRLGLHLSQLIDLVRLFSRLVIFHLGFFIRKDGRRSISYVRNLARMHVSILDLGTSSTSQPCLQH